MSEKEAYYMLRKNLPLWKPEEAIHEVLDFAKANDIDEIIWIIDPEAFSHGLPPLDMIGQYIPWLNHARDLLSANSIAFSINPWVTMNHADRAREASLYHPDMRMFTNARGTEHTCRPCPMDTTWQEWLIDAYRLYASTRPEILWLEDDLTNNPKECRGEYVSEYGCFCDVHLEEISRISGTQWNRGDLVNAIKQPGRPHPVRKQWYELHGRTMLGLGKKLEKAVHGESRNTKLGFMCSLSNDGRWWEEFIRDISGHHQPIVRPSLSVYNEKRPTAHLFDIRDHRKEARCIPEDSRICPELENSCYTAYSKSARFTKLEIGLSCLMGYPDITLNMFDQLGTPMSEEKRYFTLLGDMKPKLNAIASKRVTGGEEKGVGVLFRKTASDHMHLDEVRRSGLYHAKQQTSMDLQASAEGESWAGVLQGAGIPVKWEDSDILCVSGQILRAFSEEEIRKFLSKSMLIDGSALQVISEMGFDSHLGCRFEKWISMYDRVLSAEEFPKQSAGSGYARYATLRRCFLSARLCTMALDDKAQVASYLVDNDRNRILPCMVFSENDLGGRVAVYPFDLSSGTDVNFLGWHRKEQMLQVVEWLGNGRIGLFVEGGAWMVPIRCDYDSCIFVGLVNLETDDWDSVSLTINTERDVRRIRRVQDDGSWQICDAQFERLKNSNVRIDINEGVGCLDFTALLIE